MSDDDSLKMSLKNISWIEWHCLIEGHEFLVQVDPQFIKDNFNQSGLKKQFSNYNEALQMIMGDSPEPEDLNKESFALIYQQAFDLYGLIHARFIQTPKGLSLIRQKYQSCVFGTCPRVQCGFQPVLPIGISDELSVSKVKIYCPKCEDVFVPKGQRSAHSTNAKGCKVTLDGAYFGSSFPSIFLMNFLKDVPEYGPQQFIPMIYGFKVYGLPGSAAVNHNLLMKRDKTIKNSAKKFTQPSRSILSPSMKNNNSRSKSKKKQSAMQETLEQKLQQEMQKMMTKRKFLHINTNEIKKDSDASNQQMKQSSNIQTETSFVNSTSSRGKEAMILIEKEQERRIQDAQNNKMASQLKRMMVQKNQEILVEEIGEKFMLSENSKTIHHKSAKSTASNIGNNFEHLQSATVYAINNQIPRRNQIEQEQMISPMKLMFKNHSGININQDCEDRIQRFEDLNRLAFFKTYLDHSNQIKIAESQSPCQISKKETLMNKNKNLIYEEESARCPPAEITLTTKSEDTPPVKQQSQVNKQRLPNLNVQTTFSPQEKQEKREIVSSSHQNQAVVKPKFFAQQTNQITQRDNQVNNVLKNQNIKVEQQNPKNENQTLKKKLVTSYNQKGVVKQVVSPKLGNQRDFLYNKKATSSEKQIQTSRNSVQISPYLTEKNQDTLKNQDINHAINSNQCAPSFGDEKNIQNNELSKLKISEKDLESEDSQNMQELVQELHQLASQNEKRKDIPEEQYDYRNNLNQFITQKDQQNIKYDEQKLKEKLDFDRNLHRYQKSNDIQKDQQDYQEIIDRTCDLLLQRFQDIYKKQQEFNYFEAESPTIKPKVNQNSEKHSVKNNNIEEDNDDKSTQNIDNKSSFIVDKDKDYQQTLSDQSPLFRNNFEEHAFSSKKHSKQYNDQLKNQNSSEQKAIKHNLTHKQNKSETNHLSKGSTKLGYQIFNDDLKIVVETSKIDYNQYQELVEEYEQSLKQITVKQLQNFRSKRNPDQNDLKQAQGLLMLLSGVDHVIMLTNDKANIVQKSWRHFQDYLSSVDLIKTFKALVNQIEEGTGNPFIVRYLRAALEQSLYIYSLLEQGMVTMKTQQQVNEKKRQASKSATARDVSITKNRPTSPLKSNAQKVNNHENAKSSIKDKENSSIKKQQEYKDFLNQAKNSPERNMRIESPRKEIKVYQKQGRQFASPQLKERVQNSRNYESARMKSLQKDHSNHSKINNKQIQNTFSDCSDSSQSRAKSPLKAKPQQNQNIRQSKKQDTSTYNDLKDYKSEQYTVIGKEQLRIQEMQRRVEDLNREREKLLRQIEIEDQKQRKRYEREIQQQEIQQQQQLYSAREKDEQLNNRLSSLTERTQSLLSPHDVRKRNQGQNLLQKHTYTQSQFSSSGFQLSKNNNDISDVVYNTNQPK